MRRPKPEPMWRRYLRFFGPNVSADVDDELRDHMARLESELRERGTPPDRIAEAVRERFGDVDAIRARLRRADESRLKRSLWIDTFGNFGQDVAYALRRLKQRPGFTAAVVIVLALGVGATTAMFSAVDAAMLRPLPFPRADRLVLVSDVGVPYEFQNRYPSPPYRTPDINDVTAMSGTFSHVAQYGGGGMNLGDPRNPRRVQAGIVTRDFFATMGVFPVIGRGFSAAEGKPDGPPVVVLSHALWQTAYGGRPMLDSTIDLTGKLYTVVGIMPPGFDFPRKADLWIPQANPYTGSPDGLRDDLTMQVIARLGDGVNFATAYDRFAGRYRAFVSTVARADTTALRLFHEHAEAVAKQGFLVPLRTDLVGDQRTPLLLLFGATGLLLLIACANVTNLLLARSADRRREIAVRAVLGATRARITRQLLVESVLLAVAGALAGLVVAPLTLRVVVALMPRDLAGLVSIKVDGRVLAFTMALALATGVGFGLWPALQAARADLGETIKGAAGRGATDSAGRARRILLGAEIAMTAALVVGSGLLIRSFAHLAGLDPGVQPAHVATAELSFDRTTSTPAARIAELAPILQRLNSTPGVEAAAMVNELPVAEFGGIAYAFHALGSPTRRGQFAQYLFASADYFKVMGIPLLRGRFFSPADDAAGAHAVIVDRALADSVWPGQEAVGRSIVWGPDTLHVVGVVATVQQFGFKTKPLLQTYLPIAQNPPDNLALVVRGTLRPQVMLARIRDAVRQVAPTQAIYSEMMMGDVVGGSIAPDRTNALLISMLGALSIVLASLGVYAVVSGSVTQRRRELGIRAALGANGRNLVALISGEMLWVALIGVAVGMAGAWAAARVTASLLHGVTMHDPMTFAIAPLVVILPAVVATLVPARRAARTNPVDVIRED